MICAMTAYIAVPVCAAMRGAPVHSSYRMHPAAHTSTLRWSHVLERSGGEYDDVNCRHTCRGLGEAAALTNRGLMGVDKWPGDAGAHARRGDLLYIQEITAPSMT